MDYLAILLLPIAAAAVVYAISRHGVDAQVAGGSAALAVVVSLMLISGDPSSGVNFPDIFISPVKVLDAYGNVIGHLATLLLLVGGAVLGFVPKALADRRERQYESPNPRTTRTVPEPPATNPSPAPPKPPATNPSPAPPKPPITNPTTGSPERASPTTPLWSFGSQDQPPARNPPADPRVNQSANQTTPAAERRLVVCSVCRQLFSVDGRDYRCPNCGAALRS